MANPNADIVFVIDASESMQPCFDALRSHLDAILQPMQGSVSKVRFGLVAQSAGKLRGRAIYDHRFLCGADLDVLQRLYRRGPNDSDPREEFFTSDARRFASVLAEIKPQGNEEMLVALDVAADFPFGPIADNKRVIALFSDEPFEEGVLAGELNARIPEIIEKLQRRRIHLFMAVPESEAALELAMADRSEAEFVDGGNGLQAVDFKLLLGQMGKSISGSSVQAADEPPYTRALFGQDAWTDQDVVSGAIRSQVAQAGEIGGISVVADRLGVLLDVSGSMWSYLPSLRNQIAQHFSNAEYREAVGCDLKISYGEFSGSRPLDHLLELIDRHACDAVYWFCDLQDGGTQEAVQRLGESIGRWGVTLYIRSLDRSAAGYPGLEDLVRESGGEIRRGSLHELMT